MGLVIRHEEKDRGVPHGDFAAGDGEIGKEVNVWDMVEVRGREHVEGDVDAGHKDIHSYSPSNSGTVGDLLTGGDRAHRQGAETGTVVAAGGGRYRIEGHVKRYFGRCTGEEVTITHQAWREGISAGGGQIRREGRRRGIGIRYREIIR